MNQRKGQGEDLSSYSNIILNNSSFSLQRALVTTQTDKDKVETELLKQQEKVNILETQVVKCQKDRENLEHEMEMLLDRIKKLSELLDKAKVGIFTKYNFD